MRQLLVAALIGIFVAGCGQARADDVEDGRAAISAGQYEKAMALLLPKAREGNHVAQNAVGFLYLNGWGVKQDYAEALAWFRKAAEQGNPRAQLTIGQMYENGHGVQEDYAEAAKWYRKAAEQGFPPAQTLLGALHARGDGVAQDWGEAMRWYRKAADQGDALAQSRVGLMYAEAQGVPKDYAQAGQWFRLAAEQKHPAGQRGLGLLYLRGWGVEKNAAEAIKWLRLAADQDDPYAQYILGAAYAEGKEVAPDNINAILWLRRAGAHGHVGAREILKQSFKIEPEQGPLFAYVEQAMSAPPDALAQAYLRVSAAARILEPARAGRFQATLVTSLDGKADTINASNAMLYLAGYQDRLRVYALAIAQRQFEAISGTYRAAATGSCGRIQSMWAGAIRDGVLGDIRISQDGFNVQLAGDVQAEGKSRSLEIPGIVVESVLVFSDPANSEFELIGQITQRTITVRPDPRLLDRWPNWVRAPSRTDLSGCVVTLSAGQR